MKYNVSLDLVAHAIECFRKGDVNEASVSFARAAKHPSVASALKAIEATNKKAFEATKIQAKKAPVSARLQRLKASEGDLDAKNVGQEERVEVEENGKLREVQEAALDDFDEDEDEEMESAAVTSKFKQAMKNIHAASK